MEDYFSKKEKSCPCCGLDLVSQNVDFLTKLNSARAIYRKPLIVTSMTRCPKHNKEVGGSPGSAHLDGRAVDIRCSGGIERFKIFNALYLAGFRRFEFSSVHIHADMKFGAENTMLILINGEIK